MLEELSRVRNDIDMVKAAGFECSEQDELCHLMKAQLEKVKRVYFSEQP
jgi:hypothetical protein